MTEEMRLFIKFLRKEKVYTRFKACYKRDSGIDFNKNTDNPSLATAFYWYDTPYNYKLWVDLNDKWDEYKDNHLI